MSFGSAMRVLAPFWAAYFCSLFFRSINAVIAPDLVQELQLGAADLGLLTAAYFLTFALFQVPLGLLLDRFGARRVQATMVAIAACGALIFAFGRDLPTLAAGRALIGLGFAGGLMSAYKQIADWFPKQRLPLVNGLFLGLGSLGAVFATVPAQAVVDLFGWRGLVIGGAAVVLLASMLLFLVVPEKPHGPTPPARLKRQVYELFTVIYRDRLFWRVAPMSMLAFGSGSAIQTLWAGPWLRDVAGLDRFAVAEQLMVIALALSFGSMFGGVLADWIRRFGITVLHVAGAASVVFMLAEFGLVLQWIPVSAVLWAIFGASYNVVTLTYSALSQHFPAAYAGRANAGMNVLSTGCAFLLQYAIGAIIDLWPRTAAGGYDPVAYRWAFGAALALQVAAFAWFLLFRPRAVTS